MSWRNLGTYHPLPPNLGLLGMSPREVATPGRSLTATWRMEAFGVCHRLGPGTECSRLVATALLKLACLWRKNHFKPVVIIISKQVSAKWVTESSNHSSPGLFSESQIANGYLSSLSRVTVPHFE